MSELKTLPVISNLNKRVPNFGSSGQLPVGDYAPSETDFKHRFVVTNNQEKRGNIYSGWKKHAYDLQQAGIPSNARQLLNGSYTSSKEHPGDIDIAVEVKVDGDISSFTRKNHKILSLLNGPETKPEYSCDAYAIFVLPTTHSEYKSITEEAIKYWTKWFGMDRNKQEKGRIWALTGEHP